MKKFLKIIGGFFTIVVLAIGAVFFFTGDMVKVGDEFFLSLKENDISKAYTYLSEDFKVNANEKEFREFIDKNSISSFKESSWANRSISGNRGELTGSITTSNGGVVPIKLSFVKGENGWKIYSIEKPTSGFQKEAQTHSIPSEDEQVMMVKEAAKEFAIAVNNRSTENFHKLFSATFKQQFTVEKLDEIYKAFFELGNELMVLNNLSPVFTKPANIDDKGGLTIVGYFPTTPNPFHFNQFYLYEGLSWKLSGYTVNMG